MPLPLILAILSALPSILPGALQLIQSITAGVEQRGHFTADQLAQLDQLLDMMNARAAELEQQRRAQLAGNPNA